ncbi:MAG: DUF4097 family beta strand repeat protein [bacterium]|nr:MAG: DUF4097 family beta strand repeat protein [bacterium]
MKTLHSTFKKIILTVFLLVLTFNVSCIFNAIDDDGDVNNLDYEARESFYFDIPDIGFNALHVEAINGNIEVISIAQLDTISIEGNRIVKSESLEDAQEHLPDLLVVIDQSTNNLSIRTEQPDQTNGRSYQVDYKIHIPADWGQRLIQINGNMSSRNSQGNIIITGTNGNIFVNNCQSRVEAVLTNGNISINDVTGSVQGQLTNGNIVTKMMLTESGFCALQTVNGLVQLTIPTTTSATFSASTSNGSATISNLVLSNSHITQKSISGTLGNGNGTITLRATNGNVGATGY